MTKSPSDYQWSGYSYNALGEKNNLVVPHEIYLSMGEGCEERRRAYLTLFESGLSINEIKAISEGTEKGEAIGSEKFQEDLARRIKCRVKRLRHGGDRKSMEYKGKNQKP